MNDTRLLRVIRIEIEKLFDLYDHKVTLNMHDRITIIHGPNGVGKTVLLKLVSGFFSGKYSILADVPFRRFVVFLSDGTNVGVEQREDIRDKTDGSNRTTRSVFYFLVNPQGEKREHEVKHRPRELHRAMSRIEAENPWLMRVDEDKWVDRRTDESFSMADVLRRYSHSVPPRIMRIAEPDDPDWLGEIRKQVSTHLIEAQRLFHVVPNKETRYAPGREQLLPMVKRYARDLQVRISDALAQYAKESQSLDQSFPQRLLERQSVAYEIDELKRRMQDLDEKRQQLRSIGLVDEDASYPFDTSTLDRLDDTRRTVMTVYVEDTAKKLGVLDDLARRIQVLLGNVNRKFRNKTIRIDRSHGLVADVPKQGILDLVALSSGEQHELVLLYDLLFRVKANALVLIDEPELSLHVSWQKSFLPDLFEVVRTSNIDVILATHSPFIVGDRSDLMVALDAIETQK